MNAEQTQKLLARLAAARPGDIDAQWIASLREEYPFFALPEALAAIEQERDSGRAKLSESEWEQLRGALQNMISDSDALERLTEPEGNQFDQFYPEESKKVTTESTINKFLETFGHTSEQENALLEKMIFNPVADYSQQLARQEEQSLPAEPVGDSHEALIDRFILSDRAAHNGAKSEKSDASYKSDASDTSIVIDKSDVSERFDKSDKSEKIARHASKTPKNPPTAGHNARTLSESLARIYIKTHRYAQACEILERLSLSESNKNTYFADQLRFLRKLMLVEQLKKQAQSSAQAE